MEYIRDEADARSPKRQALTPSATHAVVVLDVGIWTTIVEFLPIPKRLNPEDEGEYKATVSDVTTTWTTLLNLRLVSSELATLLHPVDSKGLWRRLVLQSFDFSTSDAFNVENFQEEHSVDVPDDDEEDDDDDDDDEDRNPQLVAMRGRYYEEMPPNYLEEDLVKWTQLGIYHRPSQYGFLTTLQQQPEEDGSWPEAEDPFTLFGDIVRLLLLPHSGLMDTGGEGSDPPFKFLGAPVEAGSSSAFYRFHVMKKLGYEPHFWHIGSGISDYWKGFTEPEALEACLENQFSNARGCYGTTREDYMESESFDDSHLFGFPSCRIRDAKPLYQQIRQHCRDWRSVCCNEGGDGQTPVFFVGESNTIPHRWLGYAGEKCWT